MKINLLLNNPNEIRSGYLNIDPFADGSDARIPGNVNLTNPEEQSLVAKGEADEIVAHEILDYFPAVQVDALIKTWCEKLAFGGKLVISTVDLEKVCRGVVFGEFKSILESHQLLYGTQSQPWEYRKICMPQQVLVQYLQECGLKILSKTTENYRCCVIGVRPNV